MKCVIQKNVTLTSFTHYSVPDVPLTGSEGQLKHTQENTDAQRLEGDEMTS